MDNVQNSTAYIEIRTQRPKGSWPKQGPDVYVAVQIVPEGAKRLKVLFHEYAKKRGITIHYMGEGYSARRGPKSRLGQAIKKAHEFVKEHNEKEKGL